MNLARILITVGVLLIVAGVVVAIAGRLGIGKLPGDFVVRRGNATFYFPVMTSLLISIALSLLLWFFRR
jgi:ribose/xylose/arabinose/galactoside ABC-type transport system permease subunit